MIFDLMITVEDGVEMVENLGRDETEKKNDGVPYLGGDVGFRQVDDL